MRQTKMKNLYMAKTLEDLQKKAELDEKAVNKSNLDMLCKSTHKLLAEGDKMYKERDEELAFIYFFKSVSLIVYLVKRAEKSNVNKELLEKISSLKKLAAVALDKADVLKLSLGKRYAALEEANRIKHVEECSFKDAQKNDEAINEESTNSVEYDTKIVEAVRKEPILSADSLSRNSLSCSELYKMLDDSSIKFLLIDVRPDREFTKENIPCSINIPEEILRPGVTDNEVELYLCDPGLRKWKERNEADYIILMDYCTSNEDKLEYSHPLRVIRDLILKKNENNSVQKQPKILRGGYAEWLLTHSFATFTKKTDSLASVLKSHGDVVNLHDKSSSPYPDLENLSLLEYNSMLEDKGVVKSDWIKDIAAKESQKAHMQEEVERLRKLRKLEEQEIAKGMKSPSMYEKRSHKEESKEKAKYPNGKEYTASIRAPGKVSAFYTPGFTRSYSSPNIAQMVADENAEAREVQPTVDRSLKPNLERPSFLTKTDMAVRIRNLNPTYGNATVRGITGLRNLGNTCYMNAVIQCLSNTEQISRYFQSDAYVQHLNRNNRQGTNGEVAEEFAVVIKALWAGQYKNFHPNDFKNILSKYIEMCKGKDQQDSHEFLVVFMDKLHGDLNMQSETAHLQKVDNVSACEAAQNFWNNHHNRNRSKISETFDGLLVSRLSCCSCHHDSDSYEIFSCISLPISPSRCTLQDCLLAFMRTEKMFGEAAWDCPSCKEKREAEKVMCFWKLPNILIFQLKRFSIKNRLRDKIQTFVDFPFEIPMMDISENTLKQYKLYGVINHTGGLEGGHYIACCRNQQNGKWYEYNDAEVSEISASRIKSSAAYLLFYSSKL